VKEADLKKENNAQLWYKNHIVDDENNYRNFVNIYKGQKTVTVTYEKNEIVKEENSK